MSSNNLLLLIIFSFFTHSWCKGITYKQYKPVLREAKFPKNLTTLDTLQEFVRIVEENKLNVSLIISTAENYKDDNIKDVTAATMTFPVNSETVSQATLTKETFQKLAKIANKDKITVARTVAHDNEMLVESNNIKGLPVNRAYKIFSGVKNGKTGFVFDEENFVAKYTFVTSGDDGKNQTTQVLYGDIDVDVVDKCQNINEDQVKTIKQALVDAYFTYSEDLTPRAVHTALAKQLPDQEWNIVGTSDENNAIDSDLWIQLRIGKLNHFLIYAS